MWQELENAGKLWYIIVEYLLKDYVSWFQAIMDGRDRDHMAAISFVIEVHFPSEFSLSFFACDHDDDYGPRNFHYTLFHQLCLLGRPLNNDGYLLIFMNLLKDKGYITSYDYNAYASIGTAEQVANPFYDPRLMWHIKHYNATYFSTKTKVIFSEICNSQIKKLDDLGLIDFSLSKLNASHIGKLMALLMEALSEPNSQQIVEDYNPIIFNKISTFDLHRNYIGYDHANLHSEAIGLILSYININFRSVEILDLSENCITSLSHIYFLEQISKNTSLTKLNLSNNELNSANIREFIAALKDHPKLVELDLRNNCIDDDAAEFFMIY